MLSNLFAPAVTRLATTRLEPFATLFHLLPAWEESPLLRHLVTNFPIRTDAPHHGDNSYHDARHDCCVRFPIRWLCIPSSRR